MITKRFAVFAFGVLLFSMLYFLPYPAMSNPALGSTYVTLYPTANAYVNSTSPDSNYGTAENLYISGNAEQDYLYVKFDLSSLPSGANILYAILEVYISSSGGALDTSDTIGVHYCADNSWMETGIKWSNKPDFNSQYTDDWQYSGVVNEYESWDVTADVRTAQSTGVLSEALKFDIKTGNGYVVIEARGSPNAPFLGVEYSMQSVVTVDLESVQDTGTTSNLGHITLLDTVFSLPASVEVITGSYPITYSSGYKFIKWETSGDVTVSDVNAASTTVTISGGGTLRAVGDVTRLEYAYENENPEFESEVAGNIDAVRFTPVFSGQLMAARIFIYEISTHNSSTLKLHFLDANRQDKITPFQWTPTSEGWQEIDLSSYAIAVNVGTDFYLGFEWTTDHNPIAAKDTSSNYDRSWQWKGTDWQQTTDSDFLFRAVVAAPLTYEFTISATTGGSTNVTAGKHVYGSSATVAVQANANNDYVLDHWELDGVPLGNANPYVVTMNANHELKAVFKQGTSPSSSSTTPGTSASPNQSSSSDLPMDMLLLVIGVVVAVVVILAVVLVIRKRKQDPTRRLMKTDAKTAAAAQTEGHIPTGYAILDKLLYGGIVSNFAVALTSPPCDERDALVKSFLETGAKNGEATFYVTINSSFVMDLAEKYPSAFHLFVCNPQAETLAKNAPNVTPLKGIESLTNITIALSQATRKLGSSAKGPKRICIGLLSDVLLYHRAVQTRMWLTELITELKAAKFTIMAVIDPQMHPTQDLYAILGLFDGEINISERQTKTLERFLKIKRMSNQKYIKSETSLTEK